ncbi:MAG: UDP-N-acetylglucosamine--N-acetylmuramyl-(pentapeptide) pyrophosphoryl-undecaprenol N-acetylglucosamine transferase [Oscillospiraceae bacterium]|jgi:UDP-N-acetylglucosamine--N-acetylmuramyl-(pentapeptide) pyrophosphoryl-undecaprenol N-acetylglucosamine transferase|nr:UDP-N-acetylglucosamine--N-acetylmuramyl-(pentapeptide) pyrophosphoryl-undecaprenol N-acetylglucosamine transferase [Oscillospiraceae bacterium]
MKVVFTCGGTGGHINPALAVAKILRERKPASKILFVGADDGMERNLVPREGFALETLKISNYQRRFTPPAIWHNIQTLVSMRRALSRANRIIARFQPDVILGTGGYASYPMLNQGAKRGIPTAVHEANAIPGLATRMVADKVDKVLVSFADSVGAYSKPERVIPVGMPVQESFVFTRRSDARRELGIAEDAKLVVCAWGSLGAREMNKKMAQFLKLACAEESFRCVYATGSYGWRWMPDYVREQGVDLKKHPHITMQEYIYNMPVLMAAADVVIGRAGSSTLNEIAAAGTPCIIVPSPNVANNHQEKNAEILGKRGAALVIHEAQCSGELLYEETKKLLNDEARCAAMRTALREIAVVDSAERIYTIITELAKVR